MEKKLTESGKKPPRLACLLLLDTSGSMEGERIQELNTKLKTFKEELGRDDILSEIMDLAIVTFDNKVKVVQEFVTVANFEPPLLTAHFSKSIGTGILKALDMLYERKKHYKNTGFPYYRPFLFLVTDGETLGDKLELLEQARDRLRDVHNRKAICVYAFGVGQDVDLRKLGDVPGINVFRFTGTELTDVIHAHTTYWPEKTILWDSDPVLSNDSEGTSSEIKITDHPDGEA